MRDADVIVIGAGAVGLCVAHTLQAEGAAVTVVSREPAGEGASAGNAGMIVPSHVVPLAAPGVVAKGLRWLLHPESPFYIRPRLSRELAAWLWQFRRHCTAAHVQRAAPMLRDLSLASAALFAPLARAVGDVGFAPSGLLMVYHTGKGQAENLEAAALAEAHGLRVERLDADALGALEPGLRLPAPAGPATGAVRYLDDGRVDPDRLLARLADDLRARGVTLAHGFDVTGLATDGRRVTAVETTDGPLPARTVVLAAGAWTPRLTRSLGLRLPVQPAKGYSLTLPAQGPRLPLILTEEKLTLTPLGDRLRVAGTLALTGYDARVEPRRVAPLRRLAAQYADADAVAAAPVWSGFRPCSPDGLPFVGPAPGFDNVVIATGHGMMGITLAPITGRLVADLLGGHPPSFSLDPLRPDRFG